LSLHRQDPSSEGSKQFEGLESQTEISQEVHLVSREMNGIGEPGRVDRVQKTRFKKGFRLFELEARTNREAEEFSYFGLAGYDIAEPFEHLAVGSFHCSGFLPES